MKPKHSKFKNTGLIFECLTRQITSDILNNRPSTAQNILKRFFNKNTTLHKEVKLYQILTSPSRTPLTESKVLDLTNTALEIHKRLDQKQLQRERYNLVREIKNNYNLDNFFDIRVDNYKTVASVYQLFEYHEALTPKQQLNFKNAVVEYHTTQKETPVTETGFINEEKDVRLLSYKILVDSFNQKYTTLSKGQRILLRTYINENQSSDKLKKLVLHQVNVLTKKIQEITIKNPVVKIKLDEVLRLFDTFTTQKLVREEHVLATLRLHELVAVLSRGK